ncbi:MAG: hypothetical protein JWL69_4956 [Phycisphaerales bacterium]|nr:hypothetical protein [Phycisphaerales bacterium]
MKLNCALGGFGTLCLALSASAGAQTPTTQSAEVQGKPAVIYLVSDPQSVNRWGITQSAMPGQTVVAPADIAQQYSCVIRIDPDGEAAVNVGYGYGMANDSQSAAALLTSTALADPAAEKVLGLSPEKRRELVVINVYPSGFRMARVEVILRKSADAHYKPDASDKLMGALLDNLKAAYAQSAEASRKAIQSRREPLEKELETAKKRADELHAKQREARTQTAGISPNYGDPTINLSNLRQTKRNYESQLSNNRARLQTLEPNPAPLVKEWTDVLKLREQRLAELKAAVEKGSATAAEVTEQEAKLAEAKAQLTRATQDASTSDNGNARYRNTEAASLRTNIADTEDRLKQTNEQIAKLEDPKFLALLEQLPEMQQEEQRVRNTISELTSRLEQIRRSTQVEGTVTVTVLDGKDHSAR